MIKVLIIEDHLQVRKALATVLGDSSTGVTVVGQAASGQEGLSMLTQVFADIVLLDVNMPDTNGIKVARSIQAHFPQVKILLLTFVVHRSLLLAALNAGAKGYLLKYSGRKELLEAIQAVAEGQYYYSEEVKQWIR